MVDEWIERIQDWLLPCCCLLCGCELPGKARVCPGCSNDLPLNRPACGQCALPLPPDRPHRTVCGRCLSAPTREPLIRAAYRYEPPADYFVQRLKFSGKLAFSPAIAQLMLDMLHDDDEPLPDLLVPVPLHPRRIRERGFNQALEIARPLARQLNLPLDYRSCVRSRHTEHQSALSAKDRRRNVRGAFEIRRALSAQRVAIVDDVVTTGSTVGELARVLRRAGARHVQVWAFARAARAYSA